VVKVGSGFLAGCALIASLFAGATGAAEKTLTLASTTSTENSGLFRFLLPPFEKSTGIKVRVIAAGTGQAIRLARNGDADVLMVHHKPSEEKFVADGFGVKRNPLMYNDFVIVGPAADQAKIKGLRTATDAFARIAKSQALFASRGDESGTHRSEEGLWKAAGIDRGEASGGWYRELGAGMGATLNAAVAMGAYTLTDRATWAAFGNRGSHRILLEGDPLLFNQYSVIMVDPRRHPHVKLAEAWQFVDWLLAEEGQTRIEEFKINGKQMFFPNAAHPGCE